ncbi:MAG: translation initiation factor IF-2 [Bernardetiaceae bacterium]|nr:translation initiation factor IF-2 [Bernardetiaceae bacterium]
MSEKKTKIRLSKAARDLNVSTQRIAEYLGIENSTPNTPLSNEQFEMVSKQFENSKKVKKEAAEIAIGNNSGRDIVVTSKQSEQRKSEQDDDDAKEEKTFNIQDNSPKVRTSIKIKGDDHKEPETITGKSKGYRPIGKIELDKNNNPVRKKEPKKEDAKKDVQETKAPENKKEIEPVKKITDAPKEQQIKKPEQNVEGIKNQTKTDDKTSQAPPKKEALKENEINAESDAKNTVKNEAKPEKIEQQKTTENLKTVDITPKAKETKQEKTESQNDILPNATAKTPKSEETLHTKDENQEPIVSEKKTPKKQSPKNTNSENTSKTTIEDKEGVKGPAKQDMRKETEPKSQAQKPPKKEVKQEVKIEPTAIHIDDDDDDDEDVIAGKAKRLPGLKVLGKIELPGKKKRKTAVAADDDEANPKKKRRRRRRRTRRKSATAAGDATTTTTATTTATPKTTEGDDKAAASTSTTTERPKKKRRTKRKKESASDKEVQEQMKATLAKMSGTNTKSSARRSQRKERKAANAKAEEERQKVAQEEATVIKVTEFISANELAGIMDVHVNEVIAKSISLGTLVTINQRLDGDTITLIADEFGFNVEFISAEEEADIAVEEEIDKQDDLLPRAPIVTIMGHVDHGKTSLLDYIRKANVAGGEAGGITQHIGAYTVDAGEGKSITFLDTPGHEAFTAMRARGAKVTDVVIIVVAADDGVMPQTKEAINHAQLAEVPIIIAINKIDKDGADPERIKKELAELNILVDDWGGKYQCQEISAKTGLGVDDLLEKIVFEADVLELQANPNRPAVGTVVEASLDRGRGYVTNLLIQSGTLKIGDVVLAGAHYGKVKAMLDHYGQRITEAKPSAPVQILGLDGAPQAGDRFNVMTTDREARDIASKREQILREQSIRASRRLTLSDIGRRRAIGNFQQLNLIIKGDVDGSIEAIADALLKLSSEEVEVNIIHKAVGQVSESDVLLSTASDAVIIGFQVRPSRNAKRLAETENVEIRTYSIIYQVIDDVKLAIEGLLAPKIEESILGTVEVRDVFKISKVGTIAGCMVTSGTIKRNSRVRIIREGVVVFTGEVDTLKRFKDDANEVKNGFECGLKIKGYNDLQVEDEIEVFEEIEIKRTFEEASNAQQQAQK